MATKETIYSKIPWLLLKLRKDSLSFEAVVGYCSVALCSSIIITKSQYNVVRQLSATSELSTMST